MTTYVDVPAALGGTISVLTGPRLLSGVTDGPQLAAHRRRWGYRPTVSAAHLVELVRSAELTGRGGAGFPFSRKLSAAIAAGRRRAVVVNASEGEPGSAKDSALALTAPHLVLDGAAVVASALGVEQVQVVVPGERPAVAAAFQEAIAESDAGVEFVTAPTTSGFVGGQARAVLELLAGRENLPVTAWEPEAISGLRGRPTVLSNAETFAQVATLCALGRREYGRLGTSLEPGTTLLTVGGDGATGAVIEVPYGVWLTDVLRECGYGLRAPLVVGGYHGNWLTAEQADRLTVSRRDLADAGANLGAGVLLPVHRTACPVTLTAQVVTYLAGQSALRCGPCFNGLPALAEACSALAQGRAGESVLARIEQLMGEIPGRGACAHPDGTVRLVRSLLRAFPGEVAGHLVGPCGYTAASGTPATSATTADPATPIDPAIPTSTDQAVTGR